MLCDNKTSRASRTRWHSSNAPIGLSTFDVPCMSAKLVQELDHSPWSTTDDGITNLLADSGKSIIANRQDEINDPPAG